jgi:sugar-specific transcriptional regulator TrmB
VELLESAELSIEELFQKVSDNLGLSTYEARVYVSLVMEGASEAGKLSVRCGVPRTKVYHTLKKLVEKGLVFELPETPRKFAPLSPAEAFEQYLLHSKERTSERVISLLESREIVSFLEEEYKKMKLTIEPKKEEVWIVRGKSEMLNKMRGMLSEAEKSVVVVTTEKGFVLFYKSFSKLLDKLVEDGVNVQIETPINSNNGSLAQELRYVCKVKHAKVDLPLLYLCVDDHTFFLAKLESENSLGVFCDNLVLCDLFSLLLPRSN